MSMQWYEHAGNRQKVVRDVSNLVYKGLVLSFDGGPVHAGAGGGGRAVASWGASEHCLHHSARHIHTYGYMYADT